MAREYVLVGKERKYPFMVSNVGLAMMERETGLKLPQLLAMVSLTQEAVKGKKNMVEIAAEMRLGIFEVLSLLYAGLEGHRLKFRTKDTPWTLDEASDVLEDCGGMAGVQEVLNTAMAEFWPKLLGDAVVGGAAPPGKTTTVKRRTSRKRSVSSSKKPSK